MFRLIFLSFVVTTTAISSLSEIEDDCRQCTANGTQVFVKLIVEPIYQAEYVCKSSAILVSKFGIVVDRICHPTECKNITTRPISRTFSRYDLFCDHVETESGSFHATILEIIKNYLEILLMSTIFALLVLKKSILEKCLKKRTLTFFKHSSRDQQVEENKI